MANQYLHKFTQQQEIEITSMYMSGISSHKLGKLFNTYHNTIADIVNRNGGTMRQNKDANRIYPLDEHIFDICDTEEKAYWLGFMYADGCINRSKTLVIDIAIKDINHLEKFKSFMKVSNPIRHQMTFLNGKRFEHVGIFITSQHMAKILLERYGMIPNHKSMNNLANIPENLRIHWIRGFFDGDGCVTSHHISFLGKEDEIDFIINFFDTTGSRKKTLHRGMFYWHVYTNNADRILHTMYDNASIFLERKRKRKSKGGD